MVAGTLVTLASLPVYALCFRLWGAMGLAAASDLGIAVQTLVLAILLHRRRMVSLASLDHRELLRCTAAGLSAGAVAWAAARLLAATAAHLGLHAARLLDAATLLVGGLLWMAAAAAILSLLGSALPGVAMRRLGLAR